MAISTKDWKTSDTDFDIAGIRRGGFGGRNKRKNKNAVLALVSLLFVVVFGLLVALLFQHTNKPKEEAVKERVVVVTEPQKPAPIPMVNVLVPAQEIEAGKLLDPVMFRVIEKPAIAVSEDSVRSFEEIKGLYPRSILAANQPLVKDLFTAVRPPNQVSAKIPVGFRAVTINVNATTAVEGWANPGASVDVHWISNITGEQTATLLVQNAKVLSAERQVEGQNVGPGAVVPTTVTMLVSEKDAQKISLASTSGQLVLHLRGATDTGQVASTSGSLTYRDLLSTQKRADPNTEGSIRIRNNQGEIEEWVLIGGKLQKKER